MPIREGRQQCEARKRDGTRCPRTAIEGGTVCLGHGGSAPQVRDNARYIALLEQRLAAFQEWEADPGVPGQLTSRQIDLLGKAAIAERAVWEYEARMAALARLRKELRLQRQTIANAE